MNCEFYIFGELDNGYCQFPRDYSENLFKKFRRLAKSESQIIIHRDNDLMYYTYVRNLDVPERYIGLCFVLNDAYISTPQALRSIFEHIISDMALKGEILKISNEGNLTALVSDLSDKRHEINRIRDIFGYELTPLLNSASKLPPVKYDIVNDTTLYLDLDSDPTIIRQKALEIPFVIIYKDSNPDDESLTSYKSVIRQLNAKNNALAEDLTNLEKKYKKVKRQQHELAWVVLLSIFLLLGGLAFVFTKINLDNANVQISNLNDNIEELNTELYSTKFSLTKSQNQVDSLDSDLKSAKLLIKRLNAEKATLQSDNSYLRRQVSSLRDEINSYF